MKSLSLFTMRTLGKQEETIVSNKNVDTIGHERGDEEHIRHIDGSDTSYELVGANKSIKSSKAKVKEVSVNESINELVNYCLITYQRNRGF